MIRSYPTMLIALTLMPVGTAFIFPCTTAMLSRVVPSRQRGLYMGVQHTFGGVSRVAFPLIAGYAMGGVARGILVGAIVFLISALFTHPVVYNIWIVGLFVFLTAVVFSLGGLINGIFATKFDDVSIFPTFVLTPLTYFGGVFYSIKDLPPIWQTLTQFNPILYMVDGFRYGFFGFSDVDIRFSIVMLVVFTILLAGVAWYLLKKGIGLRS